MLEDAAVHIDDVEGSIGSIGREHGAEALDVQPVAQVTHGHRSQGATGDVRQVGHVDDSLGHVGELAQPLPRVAVLHGIERGLGLLGAVEEVQPMLAVAEDALRREVHPQRAQRECGGCDEARDAIGAALHGAGPVDAVDIDEAAVRATMDNAQANGAQVQAGLPDRAQGRYQVVLANILATPLKVLAPLLCAHVAAGGHLVLAGILSRQVDELKDAYAPWLALQVADELDGWVLMTAQRP